MPTMTRNGDVRVIPDVLVEQYSSRGWEPVDEQSTDPGELKGKALDAALTDAGLSTSGTADEKRARLSEHTANQHEEQA